MNIKDFKVGQDAWIFMKGGHISKTTITKIGRKYVYTAEYWECRYAEQHWLKEGLVEEKDWGDRKLLFSTEDALHEYLERKDLEGWLFDKMQKGVRNTYTLEQLRKIKEILEGE